MYSNPKCYVDITGAYPAEKIPGYSPYNYVPTPKNYCFCQDPEIVKNIPFKNQTCPDGQACGVCAPDYMCNVCNADLDYLCSNNY